MNSTDQLKDKKTMALAIHKNVKFLPLSLAVGSGWLQIRHCTAPIILTARSRPERGVFDSNPS
jgi:hypothetical protein